MDGDRSAVNPDHPDRVRWNARYRDHALPGPGRPRLLVEALAAGIPDGPVLELACGVSASALALAQMGRPVTAVDVSDVALELLLRAAREPPAVTCVAWRVRSSRGVGPAAGRGCARRPDDR